MTATTDPISLRYSPFLFATQVCPSPPAMPRGTTQMEEEDEVHFLSQCAVSLILPHLLIPLLHTGTNLVTNTVSPDHPRSSNSVITFAVCTSFRYFLSGRAILAAPSFCRNHCKLSDIRIKHRSVHIVCPEISACSFGHATETA